MNTGDSHSSSDYVIRNRRDGGDIHTSLLSLRQTLPPAQEEAQRWRVLFPEAFVLLGEPELQAAVAKHPEDTPPLPGFCFVKTHFLGRNYAALSERGRAGRGQDGSSWIRELGSFSQPEKGADLGGGDCALGGPWTGVAFGHPTCHAGLGNLDTAITCGFQGRTQTRGPSLTNVDSLGPLRHLLEWGGAPVSNEMELLAPEITPGSSPGSPHFMFKLLPGLWTVIFCLTFLIDPPPIP